MPSFTFTDPGGRSYTVNGPDGSTAQQAFGILQQQIGQKPAVNPAVDFAKSVPGGFVGGLANTLSAGGQAAQIEMGQPVDVPDAATTKQALEKNVTGDLYQPQGRAGQFGNAIGEALGNPTTYIGPGGLGLKVGGAVLSAAGGEGAGQLAEGTPYEGPARVAGSLIGGAAGIKALGPTAERAAVPTIDEVRVAKDARYSAARNSGLILDSQKIASDFAAPAQQDLTNGPRYAFTGGQNGTAPKTFAVLDELQNPPSGAVTTAPNLDTLRIRLNNIAGETGPNSKPTPDAKAAMVLKSKLADYLENIPQDHIVAGDASNYVSNIKNANANNAAFQRASTVAGKIQRAETNAEGGIATSPDNQIKAQIRTILNNPKAQRGFTQDEIAAMADVNKGSVTSRILRQVGRGGAGVIPIGAHIGAAYMTGGASIPASIAIGAPLYGARKVAEVLTRRAAAGLQDKILMRSPEYQARVAETDLRNALTQNSRNMTNRAAVVRALMSAVQ